MASINITELRLAGSELFQDSESFLNELNEQETALTLGGRRGGRIELNFGVVSVVSQATISIGISIATASLVTQAN